MPRLSLLLCSGVCLLAASAINAQLPKNPSIQQVVGYQLDQTKIWHFKQAPSNSFFFKANTQYNSWLPNSGTTYSSIRLGTAGFIMQGGSPDINSRYGYLQLYRTDKTERPVRQTTVWRDPMPGVGAQILRDIYLSTRK